MNISFLAFQVLVLVLGHSRDGSFHYDGLNHWSGVEEHHQAKCGVRDAQTKFICNKLLSHFSSKCIDFLRLLPFHEQLLIENEQHDVLW